MNSFFKGLLVGVGVGLLLAPMSGEDLRKRLSERFNNLQDYLPEREQVNAYTQQVSSRVAQSAGTLKGYAQQAASTVKTTANSLSDIAHDASSSLKQTSDDASSTLKQTGKDIAHNTKQNMRSLRNNN